MRNLRVGESAQGGNHVAPPAIRDPRYAVGMGSRQHGKQCRRRHRQQHSEGAAAPMGSQPGHDLLLGRAEAQAEAVEKPLLGFAAMLSRGGAHGAGTDPRRRLRLARASRGRQSAFMLRSPRELRNNRGLLRVEAADGGKRQRRTATVAPSAVVSRARLRQEDAQPSVKGPARCRSDCGGSGCHDGNDTKGNRGVNQIILVNLGKSWIVSIC